MAKPPRKGRKETPQTVVVETVAATPDTPGRGRAVLNYLKALIAGEKQPIQGGMNDLVDKVYIPARNFMSEEQLVDDARARRVAEIMSNPRMQAAVGATPYVAAGTLAGLGGAAVADAMGESEDERALRQALEYIAMIRGGN